MPTDPAPNADDAMKLLDRGVAIILRMGGMGSYYAVGIKPDDAEAQAMLQDLIDRADPDMPAGRSLEQILADSLASWATDDFTPSKALHRLTEKIVFKRIVGEPDTGGSHA